MIALFIVIGILLVVAGIALALSEYGLHHFYTAVVMVFIGIMILGGCLLRIFL